MFCQVPHPSQGCSWSKLNPEHAVKSQNVRSLFVQITPPEKMRTLLTLTKKSGLPAVGCVGNSPKSCNRELHGSLSLMHKTTPQSVTLVSKNSQCKGKLQKPESKVGTLHGFPGPELGLGLCSHFGRCWGRRAGFKVKSCPQHDIVCAKVWDLLHLFFSHAQ